MKQSIFTRSRIAALVGAALTALVAPVVGPLPDAAAVDQAGSLQGRHELGRRRL